MTKAILDAKARQAAKEAHSKARRHTIRQTVETEYHHGTLCFVNAAWNSTTMNCGMEMIFRANMDTNAHEYTATKLNAPSALSAEAWVIREALQQAKERQIEELHIHSDSQTLINLLNKGDEHNKFFGVVFDIRTLSQSFRLISFSYIPD